MAVGSVDPAVAALSEAALRCTTTDPDGVAIAWRCWPGAAGDESTALVLLHGSYGSWTHWIRNIPALQRRCAVVCPDVPGFGDSGDPPSERTPDAMGRTLASGLLAWRARTGIPVKRWFIGGFSLGSVYAGWMARALVDLHAETVARVALVSPGGLGPRDERDLGMRRVRSDADAIEQRDAHRHNLSAVMFGCAGAIDETAICIQSENVSRARFRGPFAPSPDFLLDALAGTSWPVLGVWGDRDAFDLDVAVRRTALLGVRPDARALVIAGAGHWVPYEAAEEVNAALADWFGKIPYFEHVIRRTVDSSALTATMMPGSCIGE